MKLLSTVLRWIRKLTTSRDNQTPDVIRIGGILIGAQFVALATFDAVVLRHGFDPTSYGTGAAAILAAIGAALRFKKSDEPDG